MEIVGTGAFAPIAATRALLVPWTTCDMAAFAVSARVSPDATSWEISISMSKETPDRAPMLKPLVSRRRPPGKMIGTGKLCSVERTSATTRVAEPRPSSVVTETPQLAEVVALHTEADTSLASSLADEKAVVSYTTLYVFSCVTVNSFKSPESPTCVSSAERSTDKEVVSDAGLSRSMVMVVRRATASGGAGDGIGGLDGGGDGRGSAGEGGGSVGGGSCGGGVVCCPPEGCAGGTDGIGGGGGGSVGGGSCGDGGGCAGGCGGGGGGVDGGGDDGGGVAGGGGSGGAEGGSIMPG